MVWRMIRAAGVRVAGADLEHLAQLEDLRDALAEAMAVAVAGQREAGITWASMGEALGCSGQAVNMRYGRWATGPAREVAGRG